MMLLWLDFLYLDGYETLWDKYHDKSNITRAQHEWIALNRLKFEAYCFCKGLFRYLFLFRKALFLNDWDSMLDIMLDIWKIDINHLEEFEIPED